MDLKSGEFSFDVETIKSCMNDMQKVRDKVAFFDSLVEKRLEKCNKTFLEEYDRNINELRKVVNSDDINISQISRIIRRISRIANETYKVQLEVYKLL